MQVSGAPGEPDEKLRYGLHMIETAYEEKTRGLDQEVQRGPIHAHT